MTESSAGRKGFIRLRVYVIREARQELRAGIWRQELRQRPWRNAAYWLPPDALLNLLSYLNPEQLIHSS